MINFSNFVNFATVSDGMKQIPIKVRKQLCDLYYFLLT